MNSFHRKKRLLFVSYAAYPIFNPKMKGIHGGAEIDLFNVATHVDKEKFEIHFIVGDYGQDKHETVNGVFLHSAQKIENASFSSGIKNFASLFLLIRRIDPDIIITKALGWLTVEIIIIKIILRKKMIFRSSHKKNIDGSADVKSYGRFFRKLINRIDYFLVQNKEDEDVLIREYEFKNPITYIPNLHPIEPTNPPSLSERKTILWVGRCEAIKNPEAFLALAKMNPEKHFRMILPNTNQSLHKKIISQAKEIPNLAISGKMPHHEILRYFSEAKYFVMTSLGEGFPNVLVESFSQGTPVVSLKIDFDNLLSGGSVGYLGDGSIASISRFIDGTSDAAWVTLSKNAHSLARKQFDINNGIQSYERIFLQV